MIRAQRQSRASQRREDDSFNVIDIDNEDNSNNLWKKHNELIQKKRKLASDNAKGCFASWFLELFGYPGSKQANFNQTLDKYFSLLDEDAKKCFVYLQSRGEEVLLQLRKGVMKNSLLLEKNLM